VSYLGVSEAIRGRLEGKSSLFVPPLPALAKDQDRTALDIQNAGAIDTGSSPSAPKTDAFSRVVGLKIPIFDETTDGAEHHSVYPSFTYDVISVIPRFNDYIHSVLNYGGDSTYSIPISYSSEDVVDTNDEDLGSSPRLIRRREIEHPFDILVEIRIKAIDDDISALMLKYTYEIFPPRGFIRVPMRDGSYRSWDMIFQDFTDLDKRKAVVDGAPGAKKQRTKALTYLIEGYLDNTDTSFLLNRTRKRIIVQSGTT